MKIIEHFTMGKMGDEALNEDAFVATDDFIAVIDGVTAKSCPQIDGKAGGRFAAEAAAAAIRRLDPGATARQAVDFLTAALREAVGRKISLPENAERPAFGVIIYSRAKAEVWRVADLGLMMDGAAHECRLPLDRITSEVRAVVLAAALEKGVPESELLRHDVGRDFIAPLLKEQHLFANRPGPYGYGVINGSCVPDAFIEVFDAAAAREIVFASDGYPRLFPTLKEAEDYLAGVLREDPLLFRQHKASKGLQPGLVSFDDRTYARFLV